MTGQAQHLAELLRGFGTECEAVAARAVIPRKPLVAAAKRNVRGVGREQASQEFNSVELSRFHAVAARVGVGEITIELKTTEDAGLVSAFQARAILHLPNCLVAFAVNILVGLFQQSNRAD